jgi:hypothetical protein
MKGSLGELFAASVAIVSLLVGMGICGLVGFLIGRGHASKAYQAKLDRINSLRDHQ